MKILNIRILLIQALIDINEKIFFYPKLKSFYKLAFKSYSLQHNPLVILDVGANKGQSIDFFSKIFRNVIIHAFEPNPRLYMKLIKKYRLNKNIFIYNKGVSDINGHLELNETVTDETSTFEKLNYDSKYLQVKADLLGVNKKDMVKSKYLVEVIRLDDFINNANINKIDILKIDTEGHELKCLRGLFTNKKCKISYIQIERHNDDMYLTKELKNVIPLLLEFNGFSKHTIVKHGFGDLDECIYEN